MLDTQRQGSVMDKIMGVATLKAPTYKAIAEDPTQTTNAGIIVVVVSLIVGLVSGLLTPTNANGVVAVLGTTIITLIAQIVGWFIGAWLLAFVAKQFFQGDTDTGEMLRVTGYTRIFGILGVIPIIGGIVGAILSIIGNVIGIREAANIDTTKAILTAIIAGVIAFIIIAVIVGVLTALILGASAVATR